MAALELAQEDSGTSYRSAAVRQTSVAAGCLLEAQVSTGETSSRPAAVVSAMSTTSSSQGPGSCSGRCPRQGLAGQIASL